MNPALLLLLVLSLGPVMVRRRPWTVSWAIVGVAGIALLWPALSLPLGVPSPAATLGEVPPWRAAVDPELGNPILVDVTFQVEPWLLFLREEVRAGRWPFWNPYQFAGEPFWSNGSSAPLFPLHLLFVALPLQLGLVILPWSRLAIGGLGAWRLARSLGVSEGSASVASVVYPLSGIVTSFLLYPMANAHALVPWALWATEEIAAGRRGWRTLAAVSGLMFLAGHPETPVLMALLSGGYLLVRGTPEPRRAWAGLLAGWGLGAGVAAIQILPLAFTVFESSKWLEAAEPARVPLGLVARLWVRAFLPEVFGNPALGTWWGPFNYVGTAVYAGALTLPLAGAGVVAGRRDRRWRGIVAVTLFALAGAYHLPGARELLLAIPVVDRALHHYLRFGVELGLALLAARGWEACRGGRWRSLLGGAAALAAGLGLAWLWLGEELTSRGLAGGQAAWTVWVGASVAGLVVFAALLPRMPARRLAHVPVLLVLVADLVAAHRATNPGLSVADLYPPMPSIEALRGREGRVAADGYALRPNAGMVYRLPDIRGDSPLKMDRQRRAYEAFSDADPIYYRPIRDWSHPTLDRLGVRWVLTGPDRPPPVAGWPAVYRGEDARVYERPGALPLVRFASPPAAPGSSGTVAAVEQESGRWVVEWESPGPDLLVVAESWDAGWRARDETGRSLDVERAEELFLGVRVGPGKGTVELTYRPRGFEVGSLVTVLSLASFLVPLPGRRWRRLGG